MTAVTRVLKPLPVLALAGLLVTGCSLSSEEAQTQPESPPASLTGAVLYGVGVSTDPYGNSSPNGFGVVTRLADDKPTKVEVRGREWCSESAAWLRPGRLVVPQRSSKAPLCSRQVIFRYASRRLERAGRLQVAVPPNTWDFAVSPDRRLVAFEPSVPCCAGGQKPSAVIFVARVNGSHRHELARGHLAGWTPDGRVLFSTGQLFEFRSGDFRAIDPATGRVELVLSHRSVAAAARVQEAEIAAPVWSRGGRYFAARALLTSEAHKSGWAIVVAQANGRIIRLVRSPYAISMFAWSPRGHGLGYTTSGFSAPHELFVVDGPTAEPRRIFKTVRHFDWITWSPSGRWLLLDDESAGRWRLFDTSKAGSARVLRRLGGRPLWCCPENKFSARL